MLAFILTDALHHDACLQLTDALHHICLGSELLSMNGCTASMNKIVESMLLNCEQLSMLKMHNLQRYACCACIF